MFTASILLRVCETEPHRIFWAGRDHKDHWFQLLSEEPMTLAWLWAPCSDQSVAKSVGSTPHAVTLGFLQNHMLLQQTTTHSTVSNAFNKAQSTLKMFVGRNNTVLHVNHWFYHLKMGMLWATILGKRQHDILSQALWSQLRGFHIFLCVT